MRMFQDTSPLIHSQSRTATDVVSTTTGFAEPQSRVLSPNSVSFRGQEFCLVRTARARRIPVPDRAGERARLAKTHFERNECLRN